MNIWNPLHGDGYNFWSGIGSDLSYLAGVAAILRHLNCHEPNCWRHGKYYDPKTGQRWCRKHGNKADLQ